MFACILVFDAPVNINRPPCLNGIYLPGNALPEPFCPAWLAPNGAIGAR